VGGSDVFDLATLDERAFAALPPTQPEMVAAVTYRPETQRDSASIRQAQQEVARAKREYGPQLGFSGDYGALGQGLDRAVSTYSVGATLNFPIWTSGRISHEIAAAGARKRQVEEQARATKLAIEEDARKSLLEWQASRDTLTAAQKASVAARESVELARLRFDSGLSTNIDTVTAQARQAEAEDFEIRTRYEVLRAKARYCRSKGNVQSFFEGL
jgi:outer membrane protein TolC